MRRSAVVLTLLTLAVGVSVASAQNAHFIDSQTTAFVNPTTGALTVDYKAAGFGSGATVNELLTASSSSLTLGCVNKGGNEPSGLQTFVGPVSASQTTTAGRTGQVTDTISALPEGASSFSCPSRNMRPVVISATYTDVVLTLTSQGESISKSFGTVTL